MGTVTPIESPEIAAAAPSGIGAPLDMSNSLMTVNGSSGRSENQKRSEVGAVFSVSFAAGELRRRRACADRMRGAASEAMPSAMIPAPDRKRVRSCTPKIGGRDKQTQTETRIRPKAAR
jgi:hypothetical protein